MTQTDTSTDTGIRLNKYLAHLGIASRRTIDEYISQGKIKVNGKTNIKLGTKIEPNTDVIEVNGKKIANKTEDLTYVILNKPRGVLSTASDEMGRISVLDLVNDTNRSQQPTTNNQQLNSRLYPVGRLDKDSHGLILLTNDGDLSYKLTHPKYHVAKIYRVKIRGFAHNETLAKIRRGVYLEDGKTARAKAKIIYRNSNETMLEITLFEGKKRQIRRMCSTLSITLLDLQRIAIGPINLGELQMGKWRKLAENEVESLRKSVQNLQSPNNP